MENHTFRKLVSLACIAVLLNGLHVSSAGASANRELLLGAGMSKSSKDADGRQWDPDAQYLDGGEANTASVRASYQDPSLLSEVPYMTSRVFTRQVSYKFPVVSGKHYFLRLHFYPSTYANHKASDAYFSVTANKYLLMNNFSASITCQALSQAYLVREYSLYFDSDILQLTFKPSDKYTSAYAFVNGLELKQYPDELFHGSALLVGPSGGQPNDNVVDMLMQTMYRLNVGGQYISPVQDSGLTRTWYDDAPYLYGAGTGVTNQIGKRTKIDYGETPMYVAPNNVYDTVRSMGNSKDVNMNYNLTWVFQVDPHRIYLVRLHFCDFYFNSVNKIAFDIYINNQTAEKSADVIGWTGGQGVPTFKDYLIQVAEGSDELWLALHPSNENHPQFFDAMLNGVEIFKVSDLSTPLAGPNPQPSDMLVKAEENSKGFESKVNVNIGAATRAASGGVAVAFVAAAVCIVIQRRNKRQNGTDSHTSSWLPVYGSHTTGSKSTYSGKTNAHSLAPMAQGLCRYFSLQEMKSATRNFDESNVIGVGGFGKVYKGVIDSGFKVAIKRSNPSSEQGVHEFQTEIEMLSKLRHKHLVSLIGFCEEGEEMCLVYDYMAKGTLREHIYKQVSKTHLSWKQRLEICIGAARGLHYLHTGAQYTIIHRDVKTTNILLDENWVAKVSDFGLSKTGPDMSTGHVSTVVKGSFGYLDPEYFRRQQLTEKSDVYSFGVVLFEVLCARPALNPSLPKDQVSLADWALLCKRKGTLEDIIDPYLKGKINSESLKRFADSAEKCLADHGSDRPSMNDLLWTLELALNLQENKEGSSRSSYREGSHSEESASRERAAHYSNLSLGSESDMNQESTDNSTAIFSQIVNPTGR